MQSEACADHSTRVGERLSGTASGGLTRWLLLEHGGQWEADALASPSLPEAVQAALRGWQGREAGRRVLLVRTGARGSVGWPRRVWWADARQAPPRLREATFGSWDELVAWDLEAAGASAAVSARRLALVCTHGRRDACCAKRGVALFSGLEGRVEPGGPVTVLQVSHIGGHRFAANMLLLPDGYVYGRLDAGEAEGVIRGYGEGRLPLVEHLRGASAWSADAQVAECWLRRELETEALGGVVVEACHHRERERGTGPGRRLGQPGVDVQALKRRQECSEVVLSAGGDRWVVEVTCEVGDELVHASCGGKLTPVVRYRVTGAERVGPRASA